METISNTVWQRKGSCIVFDQKSLGPLIANGSFISLRQMLSWAKNIPVSPPVPGKTILISGLETIIETIETEKAEEFLSHRIRPILINLQNRWNNCGIVFGFTSHSSAFKETSMEEEVIFHRRDQHKIRLSERLWDGSCTINMKRIISEGDKPEAEVIAGYYVARIS